MTIKLLVNHDCVELLKAVENLTEFYAPLVRSESINIKAKCKELKVPTDFDKRTRNYVTNMDDRIRDLGLNYRCINVVDKIIDLFQVYKTVMFGINTEYNIYLTSLCFSEPGLLEKVLFEEFDESIIRHFNDDPHGVLHSHGGSTLCLYNHSFIKKELTGHELVKDFKKLPSRPCRQHKEYTQFLMQKIINQDSN